MHILHCNVFYYNQCHTKEMFVLKFYLLKTTFKYKLTNK